VRPIGLAYHLNTEHKEKSPMPKNISLFMIRLLASLNLFYVAIFFKFAGSPFSIEAFNKMSNAVHGLVSQPVFRIGSGSIECLGAILFLIPRTARPGAAIIAVFMVGALLSHIFVLGYGWFFVDALATFAIPCLYLFLTRKRSDNPLSGVASTAQTN
jgi:uncharacterized membrane protein YphA (DoxX/SURF4 family)